MSNFTSLKNDLSVVDNDIKNIIQKELVRQQKELGLIASENIVSPAVMEAQGSILTNKYAEGYPGRRYYGGCEEVDGIEELAIERAKKLFNANFANVQPHSGSQANLAVYVALLKANDTILGMSLDAGGHLTHGAKPSISGKWLNAFHYGLDDETALIDYDQVEKLAKEHQPKMIVAGISSYSRVVDWKRFRAIADSIGAYLLVDMAHIAGLVAGGEYPSPMEHAHVVTTTTHKTLRGPRGGLILTNDETIAKKINSATFPGIQGGPLMHVIAGKAVCFKEALKDDFKQYAKDVIANASTLADTIIKRGYNVLTGGTDSHLLVIDLRNQNLTGKDAEKALINAGITTNKNGVPKDPNPPTITSGIRIGSAYGTSRGLKNADFITTGNLIADILDGLCKNGLENNQQVEKEAYAKVQDLLAKYPMYE